MVDDSFSYKVRHALEGYYQSSRICVGSSFDCANKAACVDAAAPRCLSHGIGAHVGTSYGASPRIVVVSLDSGGYSGDIHARTAQIEGINVNNANPHMRGTYHLLRALLKNSPGFKTPLNHFAMLNSAKCSGSGKGMDMVPWRLHLNCRSHILSELEILDPEIIWLQSKTVKDIYSDEIEAVPQLADIINDCIPEAATARIGSWVIGSATTHLRLFKYRSKVSLAIVTPHPSDRYGRWKQFESTLLPLVADLAAGIYGKVNVKAQ